MSTLVFLCSLIGVSEHQLDAAHAADTVPPGAATASFEIHRSADDSGCMAASSCGDLAAIAITPSASDDATPVNKLGYQLRIVDGEPPAGLSFPAHAVGVDYGETLYFYFNYGDRSGFSIDVEIRARDLNGNLGPPTILTIGEPGESSGCASGRGATLGLMLLALAFLVRRRA